MADQSLAEEIAGAAREMEGEHDPTDTMDKAVRVGLEVVRNAQEAGISLLHRGGRIDSPAVTSDAVARIDVLQYEHDEGPCLDAIRENEVVSSPDVRHDERWPGWGRAAAEETGLRSMLCFRLFTHGDQLGAINFYSRQVDAFDQDDRDHGLAIASHVSIAIAAAEEIDQLKAGLDTRTMIGQATGILMERFGLDAERAFEVLTRLSMQTNRKLRDLAREVVGSGRLPDQPMPTRRTRSRR